MKDCTVLIAEDDITLAELYSEVLDKVFHKVITVHSGNMAIAKLKDEQVDAVLTDINMPNGSGQDLIEYISTQKVKQPIVIVTAHNELRSIYDDEECISIHSKPVDINIVLADLERMLAKRADCDGASAYARLAKLTTKVDDFLASLGGPNAVAKSDK